VRLVRAVRPSVRLFLVSTFLKDLQNQREEEIENDVMSQQDNHCGNESKMKMDLLLSSSSFNSLKL